MKNKLSVEELKAQLLEAQLFEENEIRQAKEKANQELSEKRSALFDRAKQLKEMSIREALNGELVESKIYADLARGVELEACEIVLEGEVKHEPLIEESNFVPSEHFGKGDRWSFFPFWKALGVIISIVSLSYGSHLVQGLGDQISIAFWSELQHFSITTLHWCLMWFVIDVFLFRKYRAFYDYMNTHEYPQFDFITKCVDGNSPEKYTFYLLCLKALTFVLMYLHSPITNAG
jgi:hypothetical protein